MAPARLVHAVAVGLGLGLDSSQWLLHLGVWCLGLKTEVAATPEASSFLSLWFGHRVFQHGRRDTVDICTVLQDAKAMCLTATRQEPLLSWSEESITALLSLLLVGAVTKLHQERSSYSVAR